MYVCVCNQITESQLSTAVAEGAQSLGDLRKALNLGTNCGSCLPLAKNLLDQNLKALVNENPGLYYAA